MHQLEQSYMAVQRENKMLLAKASSADNEAKDLRAALEQTRTDLNQKQEELASNKHQLAETKLSLETAHRGEQRLAHQNSTQEVEIDRMTTQLEEHLSKISSLSKELATLQGKLDDATHDKIPMQFRVDKAKQEKELLTKHQSWLEAELSAKTDEILSLRKQHSNKQIEAEASLLQLRGEKNSLAEQLANATSANKENEERITVLLEEVRDLQKSKLEATTELEQSLATQTRLTDLHKESSLQEKERVAELTQSLEKLEQDFSASQIDFKEQLEAQKKEIMRLNGECDRCLDFLNSRFILVLLFGWSG